MEFENTENHSTRGGWIEVITGSMFSGKTGELIRRLRRAEFARMKTEIFKPIIDTRYSEEAVVSHDETSLHSTPVDSARNILLLATGVNVVGIDEAQFFDEGLVEVCNQMADNGIRVVVAGLDMDFRGNPFGPLPGLMATAEHVSKIHAICVKCGNLAHYSYRKSASQKRVVLGEKDNYEPLCRKCYNRIVR